MSASGIQALSVILPVSAQQFRQQTGKQTQRDGLESHRPCSLDQPFLSHVPWNYRLTGGILKYSRKVSMALLGTRTWVWIFKTYIKVGCSSTCLSCQRRGSGGHRRALRDLVHNLFRQKSEIQIQQGTGGVQRKKKLACTGACMSEHTLV